jgi:endonuclease/exonuclease/phosphatase family metal-dependent hydrolase
MGCQRLSSTEASPGADLRGIQLPAYVPGTTDSTVLPVRVMTYNIRFNQPIDTMWKRRRGCLSSTVRFHQPTVLGVQEGQLHQLMDLEAQLYGYERIGVGRRSGGGEFNALLYQTSRLELLEKDTFWLSETPEEPGTRGWDASYRRTATWARFRDRWTDGVFVVLNTHFDNDGDTARVESARLVRQRMDAIASGAPFVLMGDLNARPDDRPLRMLTRADSVLHDAMHASHTPHHGPASTFNGFGPRVLPNRRIDYILTTPAVRVLQHAHLSDTCGDGFPSDHLPVVADLVF